MTRTSRPRRFLVVLSLLFFSGCLNFKKQTLVIKFDDKSNKMTILSVYEGFHASDGSRASTQSAKDDLLVFVGEDRTLYLFSSLFGAISIDPDPNDAPQIAPIKKKLAPFIDLRRGRLFSNEDGELCGYKTLTISDRNAFAAAVNSLISETILQETGPLVIAPSPESERLQRKAAKEKHAWLELAQGAIILDVPMTAEDADKCVAYWKAALQFEAGTNDDRQKTPEDKRREAAFREAAKRVALAKTDHGLRATIGDGKSRILRFQSYQGGKDANQALIDFAETLRASIDREIDTKALIEKFRSQQ